jgi:protein SCO1
MWTTSWQTRRRVRPPHWNHRMNIRNLALAASGLLAGALAAFLIFSSPTQMMTAPEAPAVTGKALVGGPFSLTDTTGKHVTDKDFLGHPMLVFFGYTHCPDICPSGLQVISAALDKLGAKGQNVTPVFISLDGERDTPAKMSDYVKSFHPRLVGLTGTEQEIAAAAKAYRVFYQKITDEKSPKDYTFDHAAIIYLMGADGKFVTHIPHTTDVDQVVTVLNKSLS